MDFITPRFIMQCIASGAAVVLAYWLFRALRAVWRAVRISAGVIAEVKTTDVARTAGAITASAQRHADQLKSAFRDGRSNGQ